MRHSLIVAFAFVSVSAAACGGSVTEQNQPPGPTYDAGPDATYIPPGPPPNHEIPTQHHEAASMCSHDRGSISTPDGGAGVPFPGDAGPRGECTYDSDCTQGINGRCSPSGNTLYRTCSYDECFADSDCGANGVCECGTPDSTGTRWQRNVCSRGGGCSLDSQCGAGGYCSPSVQQSNACNSGPAPAGYFCHTASDQCVNDSDCRATPGGNFCVFSLERGIWACASIPICAG